MSIDRSNIACDRAPAWRYASSVSTSVSIARAAAIVSGLPLNVPTWSYRPSADRRHHLVGATDRTAWQAAAERLGEADDVGRDTEQAGDSAGVHAETGLDLVEGQQHAVAGE